MFKYNLSIKNKLILVFAFTMLISLLLAGSIFFIQDVYSTKKSIIERISIQSKIISSNTAVAVYFNDVEALKELLESLQADKEIVTAEIIKNNSIIAHYTRPSQESMGFKWVLQLVMEPTKEVFQPIIYRGQTIAQLKTVTDFPTLHNHVFNHFLVSSIVLFSSFLIGFGIASSLQKIFLNPIQHLLKATKKIAKDKKYDIRVTKISNDELGVLADHFNLMLEQIHKRDKNLEAEVAKRTEDLVTLNNTLNFRANHDILTHLANRELFNDHLNQTIAQAERSKTKFAVIFIDLDQFKLINDTMGHDFGDRILCHVATKLSACVRKEDTLARMGGDEFTVLLPIIKDAANATSFAQKILESFTFPIVEQQAEFHIKPSIGISLYPEDGRQADILQKNADTAMYAAKTEGGNCYRFFSSQMSEKVHKRLTLEGELHNAIKNNELLLHYQPQLLQDGSFAAFEALIRWHHPQKGMIAPYEFIPVAEETGQINHIGDWVIEEVCRQLSEWRALGYELAPVHINISPAQIKPGLAEHIHQTVASYQLSPDLIGCEITENAFAKNLDKLKSFLQQLHTHGFPLAVDDFGTGYSSLSYLKAFPITCLKIDRSFIMDISASKEDASLVKGIINLAHSLKLSVVAEGVESHQHLDFLTAHGCQMIQGYYYSRPLPANKACHWLKMRQQSSNSA